MRLRTRAGPRLRASSLRRVAKSIHRVLVHQSDWKLYIHAGLPILKTDAWTRRLVMKLHDLLCRLPFGWLVGRYPLVS